MKMEHDSADGKKTGRKGYSASVTTGAVALVFLIIGFQTALFVHRAAVTSLIDKRDRPDTVYVVDREIAAALLGNAEPTTPGSPDTDDGSGPSAVTPGEIPALEKGKQVEIVRKSGHSDAAKAVYRAGAVRKVESFRFDPNTVSLDDLWRLGFSERQARAIVNYRLKGGRFRRKSDFAGSYAVADSVYRRLEPYIDIPLLDLNLADSAAFDALPGIGGYFASRMVEHRRRLGGTYSYKEQLMDIWKFDRERFDALSDLISVRDENVRAYPLWTLPEDSLRLHPYIGPYAARGVVIFRENNPSSEWTVEALGKAGILSREMALKLDGCKIAGAERQ